MKAKIDKIFRRISGSELELIFSKDFKEFITFFCFVSSTKEIAIAYCNDNDNNNRLVFLDQKTGDKISFINIGYNSIDRYINRNFCLDSSGEELMFVRDDRYLNIVNRRKEKVFRENFGKLIHSQSFSPSGKKIMLVESSSSSGDGELIILDRETIKEILSISFERSDCSPSFSPSGREIMLPRGDSNLTVLDSGTGEEIFSKDFEEWITSPSFSPSGEKIVFSKYQRVLMLLDSGTGEEIFSKNFEKRITSLSFSPSGEKIMLKEDDKLKILDSGTGEEIFSKDIDNFSNPIFGMSDEIVIIHKGRSRLESYRIKI